MLEDVTQRQSLEYAGLHQDLTGLVSETQQYRKMFEETRAARPELLREVRRHNNGLIEL